MPAKRILRSAILIAVVVGVTSGTVVAQTVSQTQSRRATNQPSSPTIEDQPAEIAPQVVTIIHRLNGLKMFRLLLRSDKDVQAIANMDEAFRLTDDVHTNVIAGLAMDDGETIVAWLPEAEVEFLPSLVSLNDSLEWGPTPESPTAPSTVEAQAKLRRPAKTMTSPEVTVISADGQRLSARYVGLDGFTGLSVLKLMQKIPAVRGIAQAERVAVGANVRVFGPEPVEPQTQPRSFIPGSLYVRMGEMSGTVQDVSRTPSGSVARLKIRSQRPKVVYVGGVAVNDSGQAVGIVDSIKGSEATILPTSLIRSAATRVLARQSSVPRPFLGVSGEPLASLRTAEVETLGWQPARANTLVLERRGILLTSIVPGSPAALAELKAGDVILKVNNMEIQNGDDFSWWLDQAGPSNAVNFTVLRPQSSNEQAVSVKLSASLDTRLSYNLASTPFPRSQQFSLINAGLETIALRPAVAARFGALAGLLVVYVEPSTPAADAGLLPGDVIQSIDGQSVLFSNRMTLQLTSAGTHNVEIVRNKQKLTVSLVNLNDKP